MVYNSISNNFAFLVNNLTRCCVIESDLQLENDNAVSGSMDCVGNEKEIFTVLYTILKEKLIRSIPYQNNWSNIFRYKATVTYLVGNVFVALNLSLPSC